MLHVRKDRGGEFPKGEEPPRILLNDLDPDLIFEDLDDGAEAHRAEDVAGAGLPRLTGFGQLRAGDALGKRQLRIVDEHAAQKRDEQDAERPPDEHDERALPIVELRPHSREQEGRNGEDRAGDQSFAHGRRRARDVLFEDASSERPQEGQHHHRRRERRRHGQSRFHPHVGIGRPQDDGQHDTNEERTKRQFRHRAFRWNIGRVRALHRPPSSALNSSLPQAAPLRARRSVRNSPSTFKRPSRGSPLTRPAALTYNACDRSEERRNMGTMTITERRHDDVVILDIEGKILLGEGDVQLREAIRRLLQSGVRKILLNLANVPYMDSAGLGELVRAYTTVRREGGELKLLNLTARIQDLLTITKLISVFESFDSEEEALKSFAR